MTRPMMINVSLDIPDDLAALNGHAVAAVLCIREPSDYEHVIAGRLVRLIPAVSPAEVEAAIERLERECPSPRVAILEGEVVSSQFVPAGDQHE